MLFEHRWYENNLSWPRRDHRLCSVSFLDQKRSDQIDRTNEDGRSRIRWTIGNERGIATIEGRVDQRSCVVTVDQFIGRSLDHRMSKRIESDPMQIVIFIDSLLIDRLECLMIERFDQIDLAFRPMNQTMVLIRNGDHIVILLHQCPFVQWTFSTGTQMRRSF